MNISSYIARRYFFAKTSRNAVNIISGISILGILVGTLALIVVLSAFNGLEQLVGSFYQTFDPDLKVTPATGKYFDKDEKLLNAISTTEGVAQASRVLEERVLLTYQDKEYIGSIKGVDNHYTEVTDIKQAITHGEYALDAAGDRAGAVLGAGVSYFLGYSRIFFDDPVQVFVPKAGASTADFTQAFSSQSIYPTGIFSVQPEFDEKYIITSLAFVQDLLNRESSLSSVEIKLAEGAGVNSVKARLKESLGEDFEVKDRKEQQAVFMKVMKSESLFTFLVFALILAIASFTIMGSLSMMMLDKREHLRSLWAMGAEISSLRQIFFKEGMLISGSGALAGLVLGMLIVLLQQHYGVINLGQGYVVESYPVVLKGGDVMLVLATVAVLCGLTSWLTSRRLTPTFLKKLEA